MTQRRVEITAEGRSWVSQPLAQSTATALAVQIAEAMRDTGGATAGLITFGAKEGFEYLALRICDLTGVEVIAATDSVTSTERS